VSQMTKRAARAATAPALLAATPRGRSAHRAAGTRGRHPWWLGDAVKGTWAIIKVLLGKVAVAVAFRLRLRLGLIWGDPRRSVAFAFCRALQAVAASGDWARPGPALARWRAAQGHGRRAQRASSSDSRPLV